LQFSALKFAGLAVLPEANRAAMIKENIIPTKIS
jgi:hypothetical protein